MPKDADIIRESTVVLKTGKAISGRMVLEPSFTSAESLIFYANQNPATRWNLTSSKAGEEISLI